MGTNEGQAPPPEEGKSEKFFREFGKKMDRFLGEVKEAGDRAEVELKQKLEELKKTADNLKKEAGDKDRWKEVEASLKKAGEELETAFKTAFKKRGQNDPPPSQK